MRTTPQEGSKSVKTFLSIKRKRIIYFYTWHIPLTVFGGQPLNGSKAIEVPIPQSLVNPITIFILKVVLMGF